jgi:hypothetical protein
MTGMAAPAMGEALTDEERAIYTKFTGRDREPGERIEEAAFIIGRRGGKDRAISLLVTYLAGCCDYRDVLSRGERGLVLCLSADQRQGRITLDHIAANFEQSPILAQLVTSRTADTIELSNKITIEVRAASFRRLRGITAVAIVASEIAFWFDDETSSNPADEILAAVRPALSTTGGPLLLISTCYRKAGTLWELFDKHFGAKGSPSILVAKGTTRDFNPLFPQKTIDAALERDVAVNAAEYLSEWRSDLEAFVSREVVRGCVDSGVYERLPITNTSYDAFIDPAGGSGTDSMTLAISHKSENLIVLDAVREWRPPFNPTDVIAEAAALLKLFSIFRVTGDRFGGEWCRQPFRDAGISYDIADQSKNDLYINFLPLLNAGRVRLLDNQRLVGQLCALERRTSRAGKDSIDHPQGAHDDLANCVAGAAVKRPAYDYDVTMNWVESDDDLEKDRAAARFQRDRFAEHVKFHSGFYAASPWRRPW